MTKILALSKLKAFAGDNFNVAQIFLVGVGNVSRRRENAGHQHSFKRLFA